MMEDNLHKEVIIKETGLKGTIVDIFDNDGEICYAIELDNTFDIEEYSSEEVEICD